MKIKKIQLKGFKRFHDLTIDLGESSKKIIALVGPNGCGKSSVFDAFRVKISYFLGGQMPTTFLSKGLYSLDIITACDPYSSNNSIIITTDPEKKPISKKSFTTRSSYRYVSKLNVTNLRQGTDILEDNKRPNSSIDLDQRMLINYERLASQAYSTFFNQKDKTAGEIEEELIGDINRILTRIVDLKIISIGNVMEANQGTLFFEKGTSKKLPFDLLSSGEKEVVDLIIDLLVKRNIYNDTVYCIDEPELHLNTAMQKEFIIQVANLIPPNCQLWIATHSIGICNALQNELRNDAQVINFSNSNFDTKVILTPIKGTYSDWQSIFDMLLEDFASLTIPKTIVFCEGRVQPDKYGKEQGFDAQIYNNIFEIHKPNTQFVSSGGNTEPTRNLRIVHQIIGKFATNIIILSLNDKDIQRDGSRTTDSHREDFLRKENYHRMLNRKEIENYILDYEIISTAYPHITRKHYELIISDCINDDIKKKAGELKELCGVGKDMNIKEFMFHLSSYITPKTAIYKELEKCIFQTENISELCPQLTGI